MDLSRLESICESYDCLYYSHLISTGNFEGFKSHLVAWSFIHFILAYLQDVESLVYC